MWFSMVKIPWKNMLSYSFVLQGRIYWQPEICCKISWKPTSVYKTQHMTMVIDTNYSGTTLCCTQEWQSILTLGIYQYHSFSQSLYHIRTWTSPWTSLNCIPLVLSLFCFSFFSLRGTAPPTQKAPKLPCFVLYLEIINIFLKNNIRIL